MPPVSSGPKITVPDVGGYSPSPSNIAKTLGENFKASVNSKSPPNLSGCGKAITQPTPIAPCLNKLMCI